MQGNLMTLGLPPLVYRILLIGLAGFFAAFEAFASDTAKLGVLASRPKAEIVQKWQPLVDYLNRTIGDDRITLEVMNYQELERAIEHSELDFVLTNPAHYVQMTFRNGLTSPLATLVPVVNGQPVLGFGGVILALKERSDLNQLHDLQGHTIAAVFQGSLGGYQAQTMELQRIGIRSSQDLKLVVKGMPHDRVVRAVLQGEVDAGFIRTGVLEAMANEDLLDLERLKILNAQHPPGFPFLLSTQLYPEWPFAAMPHTDQELARRVSAGLLALPHDGEVTSQIGIHGFIVPRDYEPVRTLLQSLRLPPYDKPPEFTHKDVMEKYSPHLKIAGGMGFIILVLLILLLLLNQRFIRERQQASRQSEERSRILAALGDGVLGLNGDAKCSFMNPAAEQILGYSADELLNNDVHQLIHRQGPDGSTCSKQDCVIIKSLKDGETRHQEDWFTTKQGVGLPVLLTVAPLVSKGRQEGVVIVFSDIAERKRLEQELRTQATTDALTGLPNRRQFLNDLESELSLIQRHRDLTTALLMLDLDHFKVINDEYGHSTGDEVLKHFARQLIQVSRRSDKLGRLGGEEFCLLLPRTSTEQACQMAERLRARVADGNVQVGNSQLNYTVSIGVSMVLTSDKKVDDALARADAALYRAKDAGRNRVACAKDHELEQKDLFQADPERSKS
jgi:diguanylate cyclase (GGDEF)-like protein/PAS domain S-box-containing protein